MKLTIPDHMKTPLQKAALDEGLDGSASALAERVLTSYLDRDGGNATLKDGIAKVRDGKARQYRTSEIVLTGLLGDLEQIERRLEEFAQNQGIEVGHAARLLLASALPAEVAP